MKFTSISRWTLLAVGCVLLLAAGRVQAIEPIAVEPQPIFPIIIDPIGPIGPIIPPFALPGLSGTLTDVTVKPTASGQSVRLRARLTIRNTAAKAARHVTALVSIDNSVLFFHLNPIVKLDLDTFLDRNGEIKAGAEVTIPLKHKVRKLLAENLSGAYIYVQLAARNLPSDEARPVIYGPLPKVDPLPEVE